MSRRSQKLVAMAILVASASCLGLARARVPYPDARTPKAVDRGELALLDAATPLRVTVVLHLSDVAGAERLLQSIYKAGDPQFHRFLTAQEFEARFAPTAAAVARVSAALARFDLRVERTTATTLAVTGRPADFERAFGVSLHQYEVAAHDDKPGYVYHAPLSGATVPAEIAADVAAVAGLDSRPQFHPHLNQRPRMLAGASARSLTSTGDLPGSFTVIDFANFYDVNPLYNEGISGRGAHIGIMTLASMTPSDAFAYWNALGLQTNPNRLEIVNIDGGPGAPSDASGSLETTIDVQQSGGIAPSASVSVYQAPNTNQGWIDLFAAAIQANWADSLSISWGAWEWLFNLENSPITDPISGQTVSLAQATHEQLLRAGIQGQSVYTAAGDGGAYEAFGDGLTPPDFSIVISAEYPASDPAITAGGGLTLPAEFSFPYSVSGTLLPSPVTIDIPHIRVWGWDWLEPLCQASGVPNPITCGIFSVGGGGGVSVSFPLPWYQSGIAGTQLSQPDQVFIEYVPPPAQVLYDLPAFYAGRNVPDISFNADPYTGYEVYYTSSSTGFGIQSGWGGTSFVAPQLNGVTALLHQYTHGRLGFLNPAVYDLAKDNAAYRGANPPLHAVPYGDNWFYHGSNGYNPAAGLGSLDVSNFATTLGR